MTMSDPEQPVGSADTEPLVNWQAVWRGALIGLCVLAAASIVEAALDHNLDSFKNSGWIYPLFVAILFGYGLAGWQAGRFAPDGALTNGTLAGVGALVLWIPVRIVVWLVRDESQGLFTGHNPALRPWQLFGQVVIAAGIGMLGGYLGGRAAARARARGITS